MFLIVGLAFLILLSMTLTMLWGHEKVKAKRIMSRARVEESWRGEERRQHARFKHDLEVEYEVEKRLRLKNGRSVDISKGGMKLLLDEKLPAGAVMGLKLYIPEKKKTVEVEAEVVWTKDLQEKDPSGKRLFHSGIKFIAVKEPSGARLTEYLASLETKIS